MTEKTTVFISGELLRKVDKLREERQDSSRSYTAKLLIREALKLREVEGAAK